MLFNIISAARSVFRGFLKNLLLCVVCALMCAMTVTMVAVSESNAAKLNNIFETTEIRAKFIDNSMASGATFRGIDPTSANLMKNAPHVTDYCFTYSEVINTTAVRVSSNPFLLTGTNNIGMVEYFDDGFFSVEYGDGYDDSVFSTSEQVVVISRELAAQNGWGIGDALPVGYGSMVDDPITTSGSMVYALTKHLRIIGLYTPDGSAEALNLNTAYMPLNAAIELPLEYSYYYNANNISGSMTSMFQVLSKDFKAYNQPEETQGVKYERVRYVGVHDITNTDGYGTAFSVEYAEGYDETALQSSSSLIIVSRNMANANSLGFGDIILFDIVGSHPQKQVKFTIIGLIDYNEDATDYFYNRAYIPYNTAALSAKTDNGFVPVPPYYDTADYVIGNAELLDEFKSVASTPFITSGTRFVVLDETLKNSVNPIKNIQAFIGVLQSVMNFIAAIIVFFLSYIALRARLGDIAVMMALGVSRLRVCLVMFIEALTVSLIGSFAGFILSLCAVYANYGTLFAPVAEYLKPLVFFMLAFAVGALASVYSVTGIKPIEILTKRE